MNESEAMGLLTKVCRAYKGNADEHDLLRQALRVVRDKVFSALVPASVTEETEVTVKEIVD